MKQEWNERRDRSDRRNSTDRRIGRDRRTNGDRREINELRGENVSVDSERLTGKNQRSGTDRRTGRNRRAGADQRGGLDRRLFVGKTRKNTAKLILGVVVLAGIILSSIYYDLEMRSEDLGGTIAGIENQQLKVLGGGKTSLNKLLKEGPLLIDFWATWCGPCLKEMVHLQRFHEKYSGFGLTILTINQDSPKSLSKVRSTVKSKKFSFLVALDPNRKIANRLNAKLMPTTILVDMDGVIRWMHQGYLPGDEEEIESRIQALIGYQEPSPVTS